MIYVHVPFCRSFCTYCGFYSELCPKGPDAFGAYGRALLAEIEERKDEFTKEHNTLYFGGGTPSVLPLELLRTVVSALREALGMDQGENFLEFTMEMNPDDVVRGGREWAEGLVELGVDRVSMGVQSFSDETLRRMCRRHSAADALKAASILREAGIVNLSVDLIFGMGGISEQEWRETISQALTMLPDGSAPEHISAYQLSIEPGSALEKLLERGKYEEASDEQCARQYEILCQMLSEAGFHHYEVSNFSRPGREARHNSAYWSHLSYVGLGPGAHSFDAARGVRSWNEPDVGNYTALRRDRGLETLSCAQLELESVMLGLRTDAGVDGALLRRLAGPRLEGLLAAGFLENIPKSPNFRIPEKHFFISDKIIEDIV